MDPLARRLSAALGAPEVLPAFPPARPHTRTGGPLRAFFLQPCLTPFSLRVTLCPPPSLSACLLACLLACLPAPSDRTKASSDLLDREHARNEQLKAEFAQPDAAKHPSELAIVARTYNAPYSALRTPLPHQLDRIPPPPPPLERAVLVTKHTLRDLLRRERQQQEATKMVRWGLCADGYFVTTAQR